MTRTTDKDKLVARLINNKDFISIEKSEDEQVIDTKLGILSLVYGSTLSSADIAELGDILITISQYIADKENEV